MANKRIESNIVLSSCIVVILLLLRYVPRNKVREAHVPFLFQQAITWFFGLLVVEKGYIKYPYRPFFKKSSKSSFMFEYFISPSLTSLFNLYFPENRNVFRKALYYFSYTAVVSVLELMIERYTELIRYKKWKWYWSFTTLWLSYYLSRLYCKWFFDKVKLQEKI